MKFLIAASFLCIALVGQTQGGSLRGLSVIVPHQQYGVPLQNSEIQTEEIKPEFGNAIISELEKQEEPTTSKQFIDHLPLIDSAVNFGYPSLEKPSSASANEPVTQKPSELPLLQPGIPSLPAAPIVPASFVPLYIEQAIQPIQANAELSNAFLLTRPEIPAGSVPATSNVPHLIGQGISFIDLPSPSAINFPQHHLQPAAASFVPLSISQQIQPPQLGFPSLSELPKVPLTIEQPIQAESPNTYLPPKPELPLLQPELPSLPEALKVPIVIAGLSNTYLPPKPELPLLQPGLPSLPEAPKVPLTIAVEQPIQVEAELSNNYLPPKPELPLLQPGLPSLPEVPKVPLTIAVEQPIQVEAELSNTYLPPQPELPLLQPGLPSLPEAPKVPLTVAIEQPIQVQAELSNSYISPKPELPLLQPGLPALPEAPVVPLNIEQPFSVVFVEELPSKPELPKVTEIPALPEAPVTPASAQIIEEPKTGYVYNKPNTVFIEAAQLASGSQAPIASEEIKQKPIVSESTTPDNQQLSQSQVSPGFISSQFLDISQASHIQPIQQIFIQPALPAQQDFVQYSPQSNQNTLQKQQDAIKNLFPNHEVLFQSSLTAQEIPAQPSVPILPEVNKAPHNGYTYSSPGIQFLLPNQYQL